MVVNNATNRFYNFIFYICDHNTISVGVEVVNRRLSKIAFMAISCSVIFLNP